VTPTVENGLGRGSEIGAVVWDVGMAVAQLSRRERGNKGAWCQKRLGVRTRVGCFLVESDIGSAIA
jgi:hypothetical protein